MCCFIMSLATLMHYYHASIVELLNFMCILHDFREVRVRKDANFLVTHVNLPMTRMLVVLEI